MFDFQAEAKCKKAKDDYESLLEKYCNVRNEFEKKMKDACQVRLGQFPWVYNVQQCTFSVFNPEASRCKLKSKSIRY